MAKLTSRKLVLAYASLSALALIGMMIPFTLSLFVKEVESTGFYGEVSLRSYFERGTGDEDDPYVITRPRHLYNLSRLQGLGVFNEKKYFQLGLEGLAGDNSGKPLCYLDDYSSTVVPFLDMSDSNFDYEPITAIGTEAVPFFGEFNGQGLEIKNLNVYADPEDAGLFGYTAHGSLIKELFLDDVTIHARGYTSMYSGLYGSPSAAATGTSLTYSFDGDNDTFTLSDTDKFKGADFDASAIFNWDGTGDEPEILDPSPVIGFTSTNPNYRYKFLISGDFLTDIGNNQVKVDLPAVYKFFKDEKTNMYNINYPLTATSSISLVASMTDNYGLDHSKVIMTLEFNFSLNSSTTNYLIMSSHLGGEHNNNIGLLIGHCDGSVSDCYVNKGAFDMNGGGESYTKMANGSNFGLIGLVGGTVHNFAAEESDAGTSAGKDIGVLDFTTVYNDIITPTSFDGSTTFAGGGRTYVPSSSKLYADYLRVNNSGQYITLDYDTVSFNRQRIISNSDLGIFTIATDQTGSGMGGDAGSELANSVVRYEDLSVNSSYYVYYATGEYSKANKTRLPFSKYRDGMKEDTPEEFFPGLHFPNYDQISTQSFEQRDAHQNYIIRFKVDGSYRTGKGFYFSDVDKTSPGGSFMSHYFENKLVDKEGHTIPASADSKLSGIMLRNSLGQEIRSFSSSFATPDLSLSGSKMYCVNNEDYGVPAANMVNFEIKTNTANVTVIAGLTDITKPAALGVYKINGVTRTTVGNNPPYLEGVTFEDPDYAFFMPADDHLAYFDYKVDENDVGKIGVYNSTGTVFTEATTNTEATIPSLYNTTEFGYSSGKTRLFAHTFKLEPGQYCLGSATGENRTGGNHEEGTAKIFYLCAQGQTDGNIEFSENTFASEDEVKNVDFTKVPRYTYSNGVVTTNITSLDEIQAYNANDGHIENQRLYVSFLTSDRSLFDAAVSNIEFVYEDNKFKIKTTTLSAMLHIAVSNYAEHHQQVTGLSNTTVSLFNLPDSTDERIYYPAD